MWYWYNLQGVLCYFQICHFSGVWSRLNGQCSRLLAMFLLNYATNRLDSIWHKTKQKQTN